MKYTIEQKTIVNELYEAGFGKSEIARKTSIPRSTIKGWLNKKTKEYIKQLKTETILDIKEYLDNEQLKSAYSYIFGVYLCDGYVYKIQKHNSFRLRLYNDVKYPENTKEWAEKLSVILPNNKITIKLDKNTKSAVVNCYSNKLAILFPQNGKGKKHERKLYLEDWQKEIIDEYPEMFIRGCFQSDGCIYDHKWKKGNKLYRKYVFVNKSEDIIDFFLYALNLIGIKKEKYFSKCRNLFVIQNFSKHDLEKLKSIIPNKE